MSRTKVENKTASPRTKTRARTVSYILLKNSQTNILVRKKMHANKWNLAPATKTQKNEQVSLRHFRRLWCGESDVSWIPILSDRVHREHRNVTRILHAEIPVFGCGVLTCFNDWTKPVCFLGDLNLEAYIMYNVWWWWKSPKASKG